MTPNVEESLTKEQWDRIIDARVASIVAAIEAEVALGYMTRHQAKGIGRIFAGKPPEVRVEQGAN